MKSYYALTMGYTNTVVSKITAGKAKSIMRMHGVHTYRIYFTKSHKLIHWGGK